MKITEERVRVAASDVANFLARRRLTQLDLLRARGSCGRRGRGRYTQNYSIMA